MTPGLGLQLPDDQLKGGAFCVRYSSAKDTVTLDPTSAVPSQIFATNYHPMFLTFLMSSPLTFSEVTFTGKSPVEVGGFIFYFSFFFLGFLTAEVAGEKPENEYLTCQGSSPPIERPDVATWVFLWQNYTLVNNHWVKQVRLNTSGGQKFMLLG